LSPIVVVIPLDLLNRHILAASLIASPFICTGSPREANH
jgi:hypothetical protein